MSEETREETREAPPEATRKLATMPPRPPRPSGSDRAAWRVYWRDDGQPWRTEPEIAVKRQVILSECRAIVPNISQNIYPFKGIALSRADVEWLLATHESGGLRGPLDWNEERQRRLDGQKPREGLDLRGADLRGVNLRGLPLAGLIGGLTGGTAEQQMEAALHMEGADLREAHLENANLREARLEDIRGENAYLAGAVLALAYLNRADLRDAHLEGANLRNARMEKADLYGAWLEGATLSGAHLEAASLSDAHMEGATLSGARLEGAFLRRTHLEGARIFGARLENASISEAHLEGSLLRRAHFESASLSDAHFEGTRLPAAELTRIRRWRPDFPETLPPADLRLAFFDAGTVLQGTHLGDNRYGFVALADVRWRDVNLAVAQWSRDRRRNRPLLLGDERQARQRKNAEGKRKARKERIEEYEAAVRANRQLALALQAQGLNEDAARFAYRAQVLQRVVLRRQRRLGGWLFSLFLDALAGYGYKPGRSLLAYLVVVFGFAAAYYALGQTVGPHLSPTSALVFSVTSFHGRGFFPGGFTLDDTITQIAAFEAVVGLLIELSFIATFTQRFFGK